jgi:uncharacterized protein YegP (UPF0339 family)
MRIEYFLDRSGLWRWRLRAANGRIVADCAESYASERNVLRAIATLGEALKVGIAVRRVES